MSTSVPTQTTSCRGRPIVVGIDFSPNSRLALSQAVRLGAQLNAPVFAIHVIETLAAVNLADELSAFQIQVTASLIAEAKQLWGEFAKLAGATSVPLHIEMNSPVYAISLYCKSQNAQLLVMGSRGTGESKGAGTVAASCMRRSPCDVLLIDSGGGTFTNVLACVDFSATSKLAVDRAMNVATLDNAHLHVVYTFQPPWTRVKPKPGAPEGTEAFHAAYTQALAQRLQAFCEEGRGTESTWAKPTYHAIPAAKHGKGIADFAKVVGADLIVLGTRGSSNIHDMVLGSTAEHVVRDAGRNIWAVRPAP